MQDEDSAIMEVRGIRKSLGEGAARQVIIGDLSFEARPGEFLSVVGPSGCGKTTLLNAVDGLMPIVGGKILVDSRVIVGPGPDRAMVFQHDNLFP